MKTAVIPALLFLGTIVFAILYLIGPNPQSNEAMNLNLKTDKGVSYGLVEQYRQEAAVRMDIEKERALMNKKLKKPALDPDFKRRNKFHETTLSEQGGPAYYDLRDDSVLEPANLDQRMDEFLATKQHYEELEKSQKELYVKTF